MALADSRIWMKTYSEETINEPEDPVCGHVVFHVRDEPCVQKIHPTANESGRPKIALGRPICIISLSHVDAALPSNESGYYEILLVLSPGDHNLLVGVVVASNGLMARQQRFRQLLPPAQKHTIRFPISLFTPSLKRRAENEPTRAGICQFTKIQLRFVQSVLENRGVPKTLCGIFNQHTTTACTAILKTL